MVSVCWSTHSNCARVQPEATLGFAADAPWVKKPDSNVAGDQQSLICEAAPVGAAMSETVRISSAPFALTVDTPPPLPPAAYRLRLRGVLQKYRHINRRGWTKIVKHDIGPFLGKEMPDYDGLRTQEEIRRRLIYWCDEIRKPAANDPTGIESEPLAGNDLKDPRLIHLVEYTLWHVAPELMQQFNYRDRLIATGRTIAEMFSLQPDVRKSFVQPGHPHHLPILRTGIVPGVYALLDHSTLAVTKRPQDFIIFTDVGENDFLVCQIITVSWMKQPRMDWQIMRSFLGYALPFANLPLIMVQSQHLLSNDMYAIFTPKIEDRPEQLRSEKSYVFSLIAPGKGFSQLSRLRDHVWRPERHHRDYEKIMSIASHTMWELQS